MHDVVIILGSFLLAFAYRFRGGGYINTGSDTLVRSVWALCFALMTIFMTLSVWCSTWVLFMAFAMLVIVPHAFAENAGTWATPAWVDKGFWERWPAAWLPQWTEAGWTAAPAWQKQAYDFVQMACVGFCRGVLIFGGLGVINHYVYHLAWPLWAMGSAVAAIAFLQALAYQAGAHWMNWAGNASVIASGWWPEWLNGLAWGIALAVFQ